MAVLEADLAEVVVDEGEAADEDEDVDEGAASKTTRR